MAYIFLILAFSLNGAANILLKLGAGRGITFSCNFGTIVSHNWQFLLGLILFAANALFYFLALRSLPLSSAYPIMIAMSFILINGYAYYALDETIGPMAVIGYALIILGLILVLWYPHS